MLEQMIEELKAYKTKILKDIKEQCEDDKQLLEDKKIYRCINAGSINAIDRCIEVAEKYKAKESVFEQIKWERDCAIKQLEELGTTIGEKPEIAIQRIQSSRWIPVEERLPEDDSSVLCYSELNNHGIKAHRTEISFYDQKEKLWYAENWRNCKVIAWMPLQEYEEGGAE